jgi:hypothetical protein
MSRYSQRTLAQQPTLSNWGKPAPAGIGYGIATGGTSSTITVSGQSYTMLTFTGAGTLTITKAGLFDFLVIGGGTSGLAGWYGNGRPGAAGGGAGGVLEVIGYLDTNQTITVGAGGTDPTDYFQQFAGSNSYVGAFLGSGSASGRGGVPSWGGGAQGAIVPQQFGTAGGDVGGGDGGGGGGQNQAGQGRNGGNGKDWSAWRGETAGTTYYGGGGGGQNSGGANGTGGLGGGGGGTVAGTANTGGGGGGGDGGNAAAGGSGLVLVRFKI